MPQRRTVTTSHRHTGTSLACPFEPLLASRGAIDAPSLRVFPS
jgi:hypothetical protein